MATNEELTQEQVLKRLQEDFQLFQHETELSKLETAKKAAEFDKEFQSFKLETDTKAAEFEQRLAESDTKAAEFEQRLAESDKELQSFKLETDTKAAEFEQRLDGILAAFDPATKYALLETAVYLFVKAFLRNHPSLELEKIQFAASKLASCVLASVSSGDGSQTKVTWTGPKLAGIGNDDLIVVVLGALVAYINNDETSPADLMAWPPERNVVAHNGTLVKALYGVVGEGGRRGWRTSGHTSGKSSSADQEDT